MYQKKVKSENILKIYYFISVIYLGNSCTKKHGSCEAVFMIIFLDVLKLKRDT
jgi:hypothetical protein